MAFDVNEVTIVGRLGADPEIRTFQNGGEIANLRVATSESWKDRQTGERQDRTEWHSVTVRTEWMIKMCREHLRKGCRVYARGKLQTRKWQDQNGTDRYSTEVVIAGYDGKLINLEPRPSSGSGQAGGGNWNSGRQEGGAGASSDQRMGGGHQTDRGGTYDDLDDDIPFD